MLQILTILFCAKRIFLVRLKVGGGGAPELSITASSGGAGVVGLPLIDEGKHTGLTVRVPTIYWSRSIYGKMGKKKQRCLENIGICLRTL